MRDSTFSALVYIVIVGLAVLGVIGLVATADRASAAEVTRVQPFINHTMLYVNDGHAELVTVLGVADQRGNGVRLLVRKANGDTFGCWSFDLLVPPTSSKATP